MKLLEVKFEKLGSEGRMIEKSFPFTFKASSDNE